MRLVLVTLLAFGCVSPLATESRPCPCDDDHACCATGAGPSRCVRKEDLARLACLSQADAAAPIDAPLEAAAPAPDAAVPADRGLDEPGPPESPRCQNGGGGLGATYFGGDDFTGISFHRTEPALVFDSFSFLEKRVPNDRFTAVFSGELLPETTDRYSFLVVTNGAIRVWLGGELVMDAWEWPCCPRGLTATVALEGGRRHEVLIEYFGFDRNNKLSLYWHGSDATGWSAIPPCALFEKTSGPSACPASFGDCVPAGTPACTVQDANGVQATYYQTADFSGPGRTQNENFVSSGWLAANAPPGARSVRWEADLVAPAAGRYTLYLAAPGITRLALDDHTLLQTKAVPVMEEGEKEVDLIPIHHYRLVLEQSLDVAFFVRLRWKGPGVPRSTIPRCRFFLPPGAQLRYDGGPGGETGP